MIWLTWRQFRVQAIAGLVALAAIGTVLLVAAPALRDLERGSGYAACPSCAAASRQLLSATTGTTSAVLYDVGLVVVFLVPALIGLFWGAPLIAREHEAGTLRLVFNQSISRRRWLAVKLGGVVLAAAAFEGSVSAAIGWWGSSLDRAHQNRMEPYVFAARGVVPIGYAILAVAVGVTLGLVLRRTVSAMALTLLLVVAAQIASPFLLRPHLSTPVTSIKALTTPDDIRSLQIHDGKELAAQGDVPGTGAWVLHNDAITSSGAVFTGPPDPTACAGPPTGGCPAWLVTQNLRFRVVYVPADRFWRIQWRETGVLLAISGLLALGCFWWVRRRVM